MNLLNISLAIMIVIVMAKNPIRDKPHSNTATILIGTPIAMCSVYGAKRSAWSMLVITSLLHGVSGSSLPTLPIL